MQETISLYLELERDEKAEFEVVGLAAAAFAEAVKEIAYVVEPGIEVRLEFDSGRKPSPSAILKSLGTAEGRRTAPTHSYCHRSDNACARRCLLWPQQISRSFF